MMLKNSPTFMPSSLSFFSNSSICGLLPQKRFCIRPIDSDPNGRFILIRAATVYSPYRFLYLALVMLSLALIILLTGTASALLAALNLPGGRNARSRSMLLINWGVVYPNALANCDWVRPARSLACLKSNICYLLYCDSNLALFRFTFNPLVTGLANVFCFVVLQYLGVNQSVLHSFKRSNQPVVIWLGG